MIRNYIVVAWRNIRKHLFHALLNITGLSFGLGFTLLIAAFVWSEYTVNSDIKNLSNQYIVQSNWKNPDMGLELTTIGPLVKELKIQYPSLVKNYYRWDGVTSNVSSGNKVFREGLQIGDSSFLFMYGFTLVYGNLHTALSEPFSVVISEEKAMKYFGRTNVVGEMLTIESFSNSKHGFVVTGILKNRESNSITKLNRENDNQIFIPASSATYFSRSLDSWNNPYIVGMLELQNGVKPSDLTRPMQLLLDKNAPPDIAKNMQPYLVPLKNYYLQQNNGLAGKMIITVSCIAFFILLMAMINFINISIGKASSRIKEIGVRKVMGGMRKQIIFQFLIEYVLLALLATIFSFVIFISARSYISDVLGRNIPMLSAFPAYYFIFPLLLAVLTGILSGIYPAFALSGIRTTDSVKGKLQSVQANVHLRRVLAGLQFFTATVVLAGALIISKQVALFFSKDLGYDKDYVVSVQLPRDWSDAGIRRMESYRDEFSRMTQVKAASLNWTVPDGIGDGSTMLFTDGQEQTQAAPYESVIADKNYLAVFNIPLKAGRNFDHHSDSNSVLINEHAVQSLGLTSNEAAIGKRLYYEPGSALTVIGVIGDFHFGSMKETIKPMVLSNVHLDKIYRLMCFKLRPGNIAASMQAIEKKWNTLMPGSSFEYLFMDESLQRLYKTEIQLKKASQVATILALVIVVLGIIGLVSLSIQKRMKEIGIRKILGASVTHIAFLFLKDFLPAVLISIVMAIPVSWYLMHQWLNSYAYRVSITATPFMVTIFALGLLTVMLILLQVVSNTLRNPVTDLKSE